MSIYKVFVTIPREWWLNYGAGPRNGGDRIHQDCFGARQRVMQTIGSNSGTPTRLNIQMYVISTDFFRKCALKIWTVDVFSNLGALSPCAYVILMKLITRTSVIRLCQLRLTFRVGNK